MGVIEGTIEKIKYMLVEGQLGPGDRLPVEKDLAARLGVSRNTLREAVRALAAIKVLQTRQGDGTYVTSLAPDLLLDGMAFVADLHRDTGALQFLHVRRLLEPEATALAATRLTDADLERLAELLTEAEALASAESVDYEALVSQDRAFHSLIVSRCGNPVLAALIENTSSRTIRARVWRGLTEDGVAVATVSEHRAIYQALVERDSERARLRAVIHIVGVEDALRAAAI
ncbi:MAG TPA: FadR/GntR family transcriptional regulator [Micromonosporaceae bacterium]|nr:FadR/GntR family transcriptional regulator [Micromonosporaceae bacterium]